MRVKQLLENITENQYFQKAKELINLNEEDYKAHYCYKMYEQRWRWPDDNYSGINRYYFMLCGLRKRVREKHINFSIKVKLDCYDITIHVWSQDWLDYNKASAEVKMSISDSISMHESYIEVLPVSVDLNRIREYADRVIKERYWTEGFMHKIQGYYGCDKKMTVWYYKQFLKDTKYLQAYDEEKSLRKIKKRFNINSHIGIADTITLVNKIGKQPSMKDVYRFDMSFMDYFDGDIDELESAMHDANPMDGNTIYI